MANEDAPAEVRGNTLPIVLVLALCILTGAWGYCHECSREPDDTGDESAYLSESAWIAEHGGIAGYLKLCFQGRYPRGAANPLLAIMASGFAQRSLAFIRPARLFKSALTALALIGIFLVAGRLAGWERGAWLIAMIALSRNWLGKAGVFTIDPIIYALIFLAWLLIAGLWRPRGRWFWAGAAFGVAYMAKGTALLLLAGLLCAVAWRLALGKDRLRLLRSSRFWLAGALFAAGAVITAAPLLVETTLDSASESALTRYLPPGMWLDNWSQHLDINPERATQGMRGYFQAHGLAGAARRLVSGMADQLPRFAGVFAIDKGAPQALWLLTCAVSAVLFALAVRGIFREGDSWARSYTVWFALAGFILYSWFSAITYASRFAATFGPVFAWYAAGEIHALLRRWSERRTQPARQSFLPRRAVQGTAAVLIACLLVSNGRRLPADPRQPLPLKPDYKQLMDWYDAHVIEAKAVCIHTMTLGTRFRFLWLLDRSVAERSLSLDMPKAPDFAGFMAYADRVGAEYLLLERAGAQMRKEVVAAFVRDDPDAGLVRLAPIPGWRLILEDRDGACGYLIYRRERRPASATAVP
jgi:hypothetical protein